MDWHLKINFHEIFVCNENFGCTVYCFCSCEQVTEPVSGCVRSRCTNGSESTLKAVKHCIDLSLTFHGDVFTGVFPITSQAKPGHTVGQESAYCRITKRPFEGILGSSL